MSGDDAMAVDEHAPRNTAAGQGGAPAAGGSAGKADTPRSKKPLVILAVVLVVLAIVGSIVWFAHRNQISTDDAYTDGNAVTMVPKVSGYVIGLYVNDNSRVRKGDLLVRIDPRDYLTAQVPRAIRRRPRAAAGGGGDPCAGAIVVRAPASG
jgi:membrane fusion protein (multidrug efflux system)